MYLFFIICFLEQNVFDVINWYLFVCLDFECVCVLLQYYFQVVQCVVVFFFGYFQQVGFVWVVDDVGDDQVWMQEVVVRQQYLVFEWFYVDFGGIGQDYVVVNFGVQFVMIVEIEQMDFVVGVVVDFGYGFFCVGEEFIVVVEDGDCFYVIQCCLDVECCCCVVGVEYGYFFVDDIDIGFVKGVYVVGVIGDMFGQYVVVVDYGIDCFDQLCCW